MIKKNNDSSLIFFKIFFLIQNLFENCSFQLKPPHTPKLIYLITYFNCWKLSFVIIPTNLPWFKTKT